MSGKSPLEATAEQREAVEEQAGVSDREAADRARGILLSLSGWTSIEIGEALRVSEVLDLPGKSGGTFCLLVHHSQFGIESEGRFVAQS